MGGQARARTCAAAGLLLAVSLLLPSTGFAAPTPAAPVWPPPPAAPRIRFLQAFAGPEELGLRTGGPGALLRRLFFGRENLGLVRPYGVAVSGSRILVADPGQRVVHVFDPGSRRYDRIRDAGKERLLSPVGVAVDPQGTVLVTDSERGKVFAFDRSLRFRLSFGTEQGLERPTGLACTGERLYVADTTGHRVLVYRRDGGNVRFLFAFGRRGSGEGMFNFPVDLAVSRAGRVYVNDSMNFRVQVFDAEGRFLQAVGSPGDSTGHFQRSKGLGLDSDGNLYVVDALADTVQVFDGQGRFLLNFGTAGEAGGEFWLPAGMAVDERDRLYVADSYNRRVQIFQYQREAAAHDP